MAFCKRHGCHRYWAERSYEHARADEECPFEIFIHDQFLSCLLKAICETAIRSAPGEIQIQLNADEVSRRRSLYR